MKPKITYTGEAKPLIYESLGYEVAEDGYIMKDGKRALSVTGLEVLEKNVMGFHKAGIIASEFDIIALQKLKENEE